MKATKTQNEIINAKLNDSTLTTSEISEVVGCDISYVRKVLKRFTSTPIDQEEIDLIRLENEELSDEALKQMKRIQRLQDQQRIERKIRSEFRLDNALKAYTEKLVEVIENNSINVKVRIHPLVNTKSVGIFQLSDLHLNELIDIEGNTFDFKVAAKRLKKMVIEATRIFKAYDISEVLVACTGDFINSDRRLDELLNMATNRANATILAVMLLEYVILDLSQNFNISVASVSGNESRIKKEYTSTKIGLSYNYDYNIVEILKLIFRNTTVNFIEADPCEQVVEICGQSILLIHGNQLKGEQSKSVQNIIGKYSTTRGIKINFVLFGHLHEARIGDFYARSSSLCGANAFSDSELQLQSRASQNIHIVQNDSIHSMRIDLQNFREIIGYDIDEKLEAYNAKSIEKVKKFMIPKI